MKISYQVVKDKKEKQSNDLNVSKLNGYKTVIDSKNSKEILIVDELLKDTTIEKTVSRRLKELLALLLKINDSDDGCDGVILALNEIDKFKQEMVNKYSKYLNKEQKTKLAKKVKIIESELRIKLLYYKDIINQEEYDIEEKNIHHR